eukprot:295891_1
MSTNINPSCSQCGIAITGKDFQSNNYVIHMRDGLKHSKCPSIIQPVFAQFWSEKYVSDQSQYSHQSSNSCTINALEMAVRLQSGEKPSTTLINDLLLTMPSLHTSSIHITVGDVLPHVTRYKSIFKTIFRCNEQNITKVIERLDFFVSNSKHDCSCVMAKTVESILLHKIFSNNKYIIYDSQPRHKNGLNGSHILVFTDIASLCDYLLILFPVVSLNDDMSNQCETTYLQIN